MIYDTGDRLTFSIRISILFAVSLKGGRDYEISRWWRRLINLTFFRVKELPLMYIGGSSFSYE